ncbi:MAG: copper oxidase [Gammaproteobacteria bacterium]|nr:copper oxidase [Gammaproteobacteria bacterium]
MNLVRVLAGWSAWLVCAASPALGLAPPSAKCPARPAVGDVVGEPEELRSAHGVLRVGLSYRSEASIDGRKQYCYVTPDGGEAPTLRLEPGDLLIVSLKNDQPPAPPTSAMTNHVDAMAGACTAGRMSAASTNMHFHGLTVPPICHQDDVLNTLIEPGDRPFEYRFRIPADEPPGLYWYHPHVHGLTKAQVLGGASGALIVEGLERAIPSLAGLPERVFIIRDQELVNPSAPPGQADSMPPPMVMRDAEGDILNTGTGVGKPAKDLSINFIPVPYPRYTPAVIKLRPGEKQLWRVLNASAITYLDLQLLIDNQLQALGVVALDGIPINENGKSDARILWQSHALVPPAGRIEFVVKGPPAGAQASFVTRTVDTGPAGENDPTRPLATVIGEAEAPQPRARLEAHPRPLPRPASRWLGDVVPVRTRTLYFSEKLHDPNDPASPTEFFITVDGQSPKPFEPDSKIPDIVVHQGDVEDWIIENRTRELHAFHIHQTHFMLVDWNGIPLEEPYLRDTVNVAYWDGKSLQYPSVKLRMDFRDPSVVGTFVYHCHLLEHEDGGMMGLIRVEARSPRRRAGASHRSVD